jgi:AcrR family transcriptional regulator
MVRLPGVPETGETGEMCEVDQIDEIDEVRATLLRAANDVLANDGPAALTVRRIAAVAGVSTMNVYSRFGGKNGVVDHLYIEGFTRLRAALDAATRTDDPMLDLHAAGAAYRRFALVQPTYYAVMFDAVVEFEPSTHALETAGRTLQLLADLLERAMDTGRLRRSEPMVTAASVWAACHGVMSLERGHVGPSALDWSTVYDTTMTALIAGLAVRR